MQANHRSLFDFLRNKIISQVKKRNRVSGQINDLMLLLRKKCLHEEVVKTPMQESDEAKNQLPKRICICCALEEQASGFSGMSHGFNKLEKSRVVKEVPLAEFCKYRELRPFKKLQEPQPV